MKTGIAMKRALGVSGRDWGVLLRRAKLRMSLQVTEAVEAVHKSPALKEVHKAVNPDDQLSEYMEKPSNILIGSLQLVWLPSTIQVYDDNKTPIMHPFTYELSIGT